MGYLTHISIYNDGAHRFDDLSEQDLKKLAHDLYEACVADEEASYSVENFTNMINAQRPRHADDECLYLHWGNYLQCLDRRALADLVANKPELLERIMKRLNEQVKHIKSTVADEKKRQAEMKPHSFRRWYRSNRCGVCSRPARDAIHNYDESPEETPA